MFLCLFVCLFVCVYDNSQLKLFLWVGPENRKRVLSFGKDQGPYSQKVLSKS